MPISCLISFSFFTRVCIATSWRGENISPHFSNPHRQNAIAFVYSTGSCSFGFSILLGTCAKTLCSISFGSLYSLPFCPSQITARIFSETVLSRNCCFNTAFAVGFPQHGHLKFPRVIQPAASNFPLPIAKSILLPLMIGFK